MTPQAAPPQPRRRNRVGVVALVLALVTIAAPLVAWIVTAVVGAVESATVDDAIYVGVIGGLVIFLGVVALLSPVSIVALVLGVVSLFRPGGRAPGVVAIVVGAIGGFGILALPFVLGEIVPGF